MAYEEAELRRIFLLECDELIGTAEASVETIRGGGGAEAAIHGLFRAVHSIKGGAGAFGLGRLADFAHAFETYMDRLRKGTAPLDAAAVDLLFDGVDVLRALAAEVREGEPAPSARYDAALRALRAAGGLEVADSPAAGSVDFDPPADAAAPVGSGGSEAAHVYRIRFVPGPKMIGAGIDPLRILETLKELGALSVELDASRLPPLAELDPSVCAFAGNLALETSAGRDFLAERQKQDGGFLPSPQSAVVVADTHGPVPFGRPARRRGKAHTDGQISCNGNSTEKIRAVSGRFLLYAAARCYRPMGVKQVGLFPDGPDACVAPS